MAIRIHRFAAFELDPAQRALRLEGRELPLQPRVFDLLSYLVEHRDRVVSKEELLASLWPGVVVTEGSLQRAVSLARAALEEGGLAGAIRNYARRGYRFLVEQGEAAAEPAPMANGPRARAERAYAEAQWQPAMRAFAEADDAGPLDADALERWGIAAQCAGDLASAIGPLERAAVVYSSQGERASAARALISLARIQIESLDLAVAQGCLRRAERLLSGLPGGVQHGYLAWMTARLHLYRGELPEAIELARKARDMGRELGNTDIESMGTVIWGVGLQASGDAKTGRALQDEAAAAVLSGDVSPLVGGIVYCGMISSCCNAGDWHRAGQWTESFARWCERSNVDTFAGACLVHQAEIYAMSGRLAHAQDAIQRADPLIRLGAPWAQGDACRLMGDVYLARGAIEEAERNYQQAYQHGGDPYPGYAELLHRRGRSEEAIRGLERAAAHAHWASMERRVHYLAYAAQIAALRGLRDKAQTLLRALDKESGLRETGMNAAQLDRAHAELAWLAGGAEEASRLLHGAVERLQRGGALMEAARTRLRLAELLGLQGDGSAARLELSAAEGVFQAAGAEGYLALCRAVRGGLEAQEA
jgi:DNA-binding winged helix-turn-helix (wHTH) protein